MSNKESTLATLIIKIPEIEPLPAPRRTMTFSQQPVTGNNILFLSPRGASITAQVYLSVLLSVCQSQNHLPNTQGNPRAGASKALECLFKRVQKQW